MSFFSPKNSLQRRTTVFVVALSIAAVVGMFVDHAKSTPASAKNLTTEQSVGSNTYSPIPPKGIVR